MRVLVLGASGATGKLVVVQLLKRQINIRIAVRESAILPAEVLESPLVEIKRGNIAEFNDSEMDSLLEGSDAVVSCLGHTITIGGMFGNPRNLVSDTIRNVCEAARKRAHRKVKLILMSTTAYANDAIGEKNSLGEGIVFLILKLLLPPHRDNVKAANYLQKTIEKEDEKIEWVAVRPDSLVNEDNESAYDVYKSPIRSPVFNAGKTSRINVSHFMVDLLTNNNLWREWQFKMPVIYNK
jgi:nucleoside-diphosphate-sugar epimerase